MKISATGKRRFNQLICTNLSTPIGFSWNQLEPRNSNSPHIFWTDLVNLQVGYPIRPVEVTNNSLITLEKITTPT